MKPPISNTPFAGTATIIETNTNTLPIIVLMAPLDHAPSPTTALAEVTVPDPTLNTVPYFPDILLLIVYSRADIYY